ncbi:LysR substrate-binding domain-containing protein [Microbacterium sp. USHLN186]|uniref:LysR substrate-binding domain-containing protein n=1 Tax=Microbacterium sp. USHLN186 TaxID=3081286 RepID=UPI0030192138
MKNDRRRASRGGRPQPGRPASRSGAQKAGAQKAGGQKSGGRKADGRKGGGQAIPPIDETPRSFRLGVIPGATPGRWVDAWKQRMPHVEIELVPISVAGQRAALQDLDAALVRLPLAEPDDLHAIPLYDELAVVVASADSSLLAADELTPDDLAGEVLITPGDDVLGPLGLPTIAPRFATLASTEEAIVTAATGVGVVVVPMSLARLHQRKDAGYRPLRGGPASTVALAWRREATTPDIETFIGIVRGRTPNSSR